MNYKDKNGHALQIGQKVRVRECIGPYGQCANREGIIREFSLYGGGTLELTESATIYHRDHLEHKNKGELVYVIMDPEGYHKFQDFEHGHETWTEVVT